MKERGTPAPRVAIVGCGQIADAHAGEARRAGATVVAVCDLDPHLAEQAATRLAVPDWFTDLDELLERVRPDAVHVTSPPATHVPLACRALAAGAHVYVEKPVSVDAAGAAALARAAAAAGRLACPGHNLRFDPVVQRLLALHAKGGLGEVVHVDAVMGYALEGPFGALLLADPRHWVHRLPAGLAHNNLSHPLSLVQPFLGQGPIQAHALGRRRRPARFGDARDAFHDEVRVILDGPAATATVTFSCALRPPLLSLAVYGTRRTALVSLDARTLRLVDGSRAPGPFQKVDWARRDAVRAAAEAIGRARDLVGARLHWFEGLRALLAAFYASAAEGGPPPIPIEEGIEVASLLDAIAADLAAGDRAAGEGLLRAGEAGA